MKSFKYVVYQEDKYYVSQCLNVDVASFGETVKESVDNLKEAVELYLEDENVDQVYQSVGEMFTGEAQINA
ncbi:MAG: type II toxin-antitoxin system HicB family antitoxin [Proteobacteria bacterium]|nr:type II toxin-antitoxin system HicB family antitoxin [Pseudomonadota bacterium]